MTKTCFLLCALALAPIVAMAADAKVSIVEEHQHRFSRHLLLDIPSRCTKEEPAADKQESFTLCCVPNSRPNSTTCYETTRPDCIPYMIQAHKNYKGIDNVVTTEGGEFLYPNGFAEKKTKVKTWQECGKMCFYKSNDLTTSCGSFTYDKSTKTCYLMDSGPAVEEEDGIVWCAGVKNWYTGY